MVVHTVGGAANRDSAFVQPLAGQGAGVAAQGVARQIAQVELVGGSALHHKLHLACAG